MLESGRGIPSDVTEALSLYRDLMLRGYAPATGYYGWLLVTGKLVGIDLPVGKSLIVQAAEQGDGDSYVRLAKMAIGEKKQPKTVMEFYKKAADLGNRDGLFEYAKGLKKGFGWAKREMEAFTVFQRLVDELGDPDAMFIAGKMLIKGKGVLKDPQAGNQLLKRAAALGQIDARFFITRQMKEPSRRNTIMTLPFSTKPRLEKL
jgi:TPR repeat protein